MNDTIIYLTRQGIPTPLGTVVSRILGTANQHGYVQEIHEQTPTHAIAQLFFSLGHLSSEGYATYHFTSPEDAFKLVTLL